MDNTETKIITTDPTPESDQPEEITQEQDYLLSSFESQEMPEQLKLKSRHSAQTGQLTSRFSRPGASQPQSTLQAYNIELVSQELQSLPEEVEAQHLDFDVESLEPSKESSGAWTEAHVKYLCALIERHKSLLDDKNTKNKKVWALIARNLNQVTLSKFTGEQCTNKYKNMLRAFKNYVTNCKATGAGSQRRLHYFQYMEQIVGKCNALQMPFLIDSSSKSDWHVEASTSSNLIDLESPGGSRETPLPLTVKQKPSSAFVGRKALERSTLLHLSSPNTESLAPPFATTLPTSLAFGLSSEVNPTHGEHEEILGTEDVESFPDLPSAISKQLSKKKLLKPVSHNEYVRKHLNEQAVQLKELVEISKRAAETSERVANAQIAVMRASVKEQAKFNCLVEQMLKKMFNPSQGEKRKRNESDSS